MPNDIGETLRRYAEVARPEILRDHSPDSCVASTWITVEVLRRLGIKAESLEVRLSVGNPAYERLVGEIGPPQTKEALEEWFDQHGADVTGIGFDPASPSSIGGHIVALADGWYLVDASIDQASNPSTGIVPPGVHIGRVDARFLMGRPQRLDTADLFIEYQRHEVPTSWRESIDWGSNPQTESAVARIESLLKAE